MKYIINIPPNLAEKVNYLISHGDYENFSQFAVTAFQNQLLLEETSKETLDAIDEGISSEKKIKNEQPESKTSSLLSIDFNPKMIKTVSPPNSDRIPNDCLWGQYNRIFPIKITLRALANLLKENETIELSLLQSQAFLAAREIGLFLRKEDKKYKRKYGDLLSSALPVGRSLTKTEKRFINHFVGYYTRAGRIEGAPGALKFLNIFEDTDGSHKVGITEAGLGFASISNPILDEENFGITLNRSESSFYFQHVSQNLKRETELMQGILKAIDDGKSSPSELNQEIRHFSRGWSQAMINTIRAGATSRLQELGLISRQRKGVKISYSITACGKENVAANTRNQGGP